MIKKCMLLMFITLSPLLHAAESTSCRSICGVEYLYWKSTQSEMNAASGVTFSGSNRSAQVIEPITSYESGFRLFAGYHFGCAWDFIASLTYVPGRGSKSFHFDPAGFGTTDIIVTNYALFSFFEQFESSPQTFFSSFDIDWKSKIYYFDVGVSKSYALCNRLNFSPYLGVRALWNKQDIYFAGENPTPFSFTATFDLHTRGIGLQTALLAAWDIGCGFSLAGNFGASLLYARYKKSIEGSNSVGLFDRTGNIQYKTLPTLDSMIALFYTFCSAEIHLAWENHQFFSTNNFTIPESGNLSMQGLTLGGSVCF